MGTGSRESRAAGGERMRAATLFSGIGAPEVAMPGWQWLWHAEIEAFPSAVMAARRPESTNLGNVLADDLIAQAKAFGPIDLLIGGPPCQAFSVAGLRNSLADPRGNLSLRWVQIIHAIGPAVSVTENVPGWLSTKDNAFGCFLAGLVGADDPLCTPDGASWPDAGMVAGPLMRAAWRVLDAQYFGVPQRRRRVFVVASARTGFDPASILFEPKGMSRHPAPSREAGERVASSLRASASPRGHGTSHGLRGDGADNLIAHTLNAKGGSGRIDGESETFIAHSLRADGFDASEDGTGRGTPLVPVAYMPARTLASDGGIDSRYAERGVCDALHQSSGGGNKAPLLAFSCKDSGLDAGSIAPTLRAMSHDGSHANAGGQVAVACFKGGQGAAARSLGYSENVAPTLSSAESETNRTPALMNGAAVRRLTPRETERLQGFPDIRNCTTITICRSAVETAEPVSYAEMDSPLRSHEANGRAVVNVLIDCERSALQLHNHGKLLWYASDAESKSSSLPLMPLADFVRLAAHTIAIAAQETRNGRAASPKIINPSTHPRSGSGFARLCGREIDGLAGDVEKFTAKVNGCMRSITSQVGRNSPTSDSSLQTSLYCVSAVISTCIPDEIRRASSYVLNIEVIESFTAISYRGKPAADGPRYRALGNSMAVPVVRWILSRVERCDAALCQAEAA